MNDNMTGVVTALARDAEHRFAKTVVDRVALVAGSGVAGDAHAGASVQHRSRVAVDPAQPNLRQLHLIEEARFATLARAGFADIAPGAIGENMRTSGVALSALPVGTRLVFARGAEAVLTGLRNPCRQLDGFRPGLMRALIGRDAAGAPVLMGGVMAVIARSGDVRLGDRFRVILPTGAPLPLRRV